MEKSFDLNPKELQALSAIEQDNLRANATYGILARQMDDAKQRIGQTEEAQRSFIRTALRDRGVEAFQNARLEQPGRIFCTMLDEMEPTGEIHPVPMATKERPNAKPKEATESPK